MIIVAPSVPSAGGHNYSKRTRFWNSQLSNLGKVIPVTMHTVNGSKGVGVSQCLEHMVGAVHTKVLEVRSNPVTPGQSVINLEFLEYGPIL